MDATSFPNSRQLIPDWTLIHSQLDGTLAAGETSGTKIFRGQSPQPAEPLTGDELLQIVATGGYPDAIRKPPGGTDVYAVGLIASRVFVRQMDSNHR
jgi:hypothetical protein